MPAQNLTELPRKPEWKDGLHPHQIFSTWSRIAAVAVGSIVSIVPQVISSKIIAALIDNPPVKTSQEIAVVGFLIAVGMAWCVTIWAGTVREHKSLIDYAVFGTAIPSTVYLLSQAGTIFN